MKVGDRVIVTGGYGRTEPVEGFVREVRRKFFAVEIPVGSRTSLADFEIESGLERCGPNDNGHYRRRARTPEQVEYDDRIAAAEQVLRDHEVVFRYRRKITDEQLFAIAAVLSGEA